MSALELSFFHTLPYSSVFSKCCFFGPEISHVSFVLTTFSFMFMGSAQAAPGRGISVKLGASQNPLVKAVWELCTFLCNICPVGSLTLGLMMIWSGSASLYKLQEAKLVSQAPARCVPARSSTCGWCWVHTCEQHKRTNRTGSISQVHRTKTMAARGEARLGDEWQRWRGWKHRLVVTELSQ